MDVLYIIIFAENAALSFLLTLLCARLPFWSKKPAQMGIPPVGGIAVAVTFLLNYFTLPFLAQAESRVYMLAAVIVFLMGLVDDSRELSVKAKFAFQIAAALLVAAAGARTRIVYFGEPLNYLVTVVWIVGVTNAFNLLDVADGLSAGCALIVCAGLSAVAAANQGLFPFFTLLVLGGALCGFLFLNLPPARAYLGNSGSHFVGFVISIAAIQISYAELGRGVALFTPLVILGFPLFDTLFLIFVRLSKLKLPFQKTKDHIAFRLKTLGYPPGKVLGVMLLICLCFSLGGVIVSRVPNFPGLIVIAVLLFVVFLLFRKSLAVIVHE